MRPLGLGSDAGFGGGVGVLALPGCSRCSRPGARARRWVVVLLVLGAMRGDRDRAWGDCRSSARCCAWSLRACSSLLAGRPRHARARGAGGDRSRSRFRSAVLVRAAARSGHVRALREHRDLEIRQHRPRATRNAAWTRYPRRHRGAPFGVGLGTVGVGGGLRRQDHT